MNTVLVYNEIMPRTNTFYTDNVIEVSLHNYNCQLSRL